MAYNGSTAWYTSSVAYAAVAAFAATTAYSAGQLIRQLTTPTAGQERVFVCIVAGTSGTEPTWVNTKGAKNTSTTPVFQECTGEPGVNGDTAACMQWSVSSTPVLGTIIYVPSNSSLQICSTAGAGGTGAIPAFSATAGVTTADASATWTSLGLASAFQYWKAPHARLINAVVAGWGAAGNDFWLADNHAEVGSTTTISPPGTQTQPNRLMSIDHTLSLPPTAASVKAGASISASQPITLNNSGASSLYWYGITFACSYPAAANVIILNNVNSSYSRMEACSFQLTSNAGTRVVFGANAGGNPIIDLVNCTFSFANATQFIMLVSGTVTWRATASALLGSPLPAALFSLASGFSVNALVEGVDLTALGANTLITNSGAGNGYICFKDCKLAATTVVTPAPTINGEGLVIDLLRCDSGGTNYRNERHSMYGDETTSITVARTGGASDGTTPVSHRAVPSTYTRAFSPFNAIPLVIWNAIMGTNRVVRLYGVSNAAALPSNVDFWFDAEYLGSSGSPLGSFASGGIANQLTAASAFAVADTSAWGSAAPARANSTTYAVGAVIKLASNPGRIFFCTASSGNTAASEPGGYASAVDGGSVTDGACTFRAGVRWTAALTLSAPQPAQAGYITAYPKFGTNVAAAIHIDPLIVLA